MVFNLDFSKKKKQKKMIYKKGCAIFDTSCIATRHLDYALSSI